MAESVALLVSMCGEEALAARDKRYVGVLGLTHVASPPKPPLCVQSHHPTSNPGDHLTIPPLSPLPFQSRFYAAGK